MLQEVTEGQGSQDLGGAGAGSRTEGGAVSSLWFRENSCSFSSSSFGSVVNCLLGRKKEKRERESRN